MLGPTLAAFKARHAIVRKRFIAFDERLDALAERHARPLRVLGTVLAFLLLFGGVALHAYETGFVRTAAAACGTMCKGSPDAAIAAYCGLFALLYVHLYAMLTGGVQRAFIDPWKHVRPEPAPARVTRWAVVTHVLIGLVVFFAIAAYGDTSALASGQHFFSFEGGPVGGTEVSLGDHALLEWVIGWCIGGRGVLQYHWPKPTVPKPHAPS